MNQGDRVRKVGGDYRFEGVIVGVVTKRSGALRYVVEDDRGLLFILNAGQLEPQGKPDLLGASSGGSSPAASPAAPEPGRVYWFAERNALYIAAEQWRERLKLTADPLAARRFDTREECQAFLNAATIETMRPVEHMFMGAPEPAKCATCGGRRYVGVCDCAAAQDGLDGHEWECSAFAAADGPMAKRKPCPACSGGAAAEGGR